MNACLVTVEKGIEIAVLLLNIQISVCKEDYREVFNGCSRRAAGSMKQLSLQFIGRHFSLSVSALQSVV
jgi:hypothetical protein